MNWCWPFEVGVILDERKESVVRDVQRGIWGSLFFSNWYREHF